MRARAHWWWLCRRRISWRWCVTLNKCKWRRRARSLARLSFSHLVARCRLVRWWWCSGGALAAAAPRRHRHAGPCARAQTHAHTHGVHRGQKRSAQRAGANANGEARWREMSGRRQELCARTERSSQSVVCVCVFWRSSCRTCARVCCGGAAGDENDCAKTPPNQSCVCVCVRAKVRPRLSSTFSSPLARRPHDNTVVAPLATRAHQISAPIRLTRILLLIILLADYFRAIAPILCGPTIATTQFQHY